MEIWIFRFLPFPYCLLYDHYSTLSICEVEINFAVTELNCKCLKQFSGGWLNPFIHKFQDTHLNVLVNNDWKKPLLITFTLFSSCSNTPGCLFSYFNSQHILTLQVFQSRKYLPIITYLYISKLKSLNIVLI